MGHLSLEFIRFLYAVFNHWQTWLSGGGVGGFLVVAIGVVDKLLGKSLTKRHFVYLFLVFFFICSRFLAWVDNDDALRATQTAKDAQFTSDIRLLQTSQDHFGELKAQCQYQSGVVDTLRKQNGDQQNSINNCQTQAIQHLIPEPERDSIHEVELEKVPNVRAFIFTTNKVVTPAIIILRCEEPVRDVQVGLMQVRAMTASLPKVVAPNTWMAKVVSPAWTPDIPMIIQFAPLTERDPQCVIQRR